MSPYKPCDNIQSAHSPDVSEVGATKVKTGSNMLCSREHGHVMFISQLVVSPYRPLHIYITLPRPEYKAHVATGSVLALSFFPTYTW